MYYWSNGQIRHVVDLVDVQADRFNGSLGDNNPLHTAAVSDDGTVVQFQSQRSAAGADTAGRTMIYRYDAATDELECASCRPDGRPSTGDAATYTSPTTFGGIRTTNGYRKRGISTDGRRVFFDTPDPLVPEDVNGTRDVYLWQDGRAHLLSSGRDPSPSHFTDASESGDDVFFTTRARLVAEDVDSNVDLYDARVGGGHPEPAGPAGRCEDDACQGAPAATPTAPAVGSATFRGAGNPALTPSARAVRGSVRVARTGVRRGTVATLRVTVSAAGAIRLSGASVRSVTRTAGRSGTYVVKAVLTPRARRSLARHKAWRAGVRVAFTPRGGRATTRRLTITFHKAGGRS
jgi:hypothetical protein